MTQSGGTNNVFPAFSGFLVQSLGLQGPPGSIASAISATSIDYGIATTCLPASVTNVDAALAWFETNVACLLDPPSILAAPDGYILVWDSAEMKLVPRTIGSALGSGLPGNSNNDVLLYNTLSSSYTPTSLLSWLDTNLPGELPDAFNAIFPCNTPGQILSCTASGWSATSFLQAFNTGLPGTNSFDLVYWNAGTGSWQPTDAGSVIGNNLPAALTNAFPCTTGDLLTCIGGQWQSTTFQAAMSSGLPGSTASDILVWNGAQWVSQEEQTWLTQVLGPALGSQSLTALSDTPASFGSAGQVLAINAAGNGTVWQAATTGGSLPAGNTGDIVTYDATGTNGVARTLPEYLDRYYPSGGFCHATLVNDGGGWAVAEGITPVIQNWVFPLAPQSVGLELEIDPNTLCAEWVAPSHVVGTFTIPGDFPTVQDFMTWATGRSVEVDLNVQAAQNGITFAGPNGRVDINGNGQPLGEIVAAEVQLSAAISNATLDSIFVGNNVTLRLNTITQVNNTNGVGINVQSGGHLINAGNLTVVGNGLVGVQVGNSSSMIVAGNLTSTATMTRFGLFIDTGSSLRVQGDIEVANSNVGINIEDNSVLTVNGGLSSNNNTQAGIQLIQSVMNADAGVGNTSTLQASGNGTDGISLTDGSSILSDLNSIRVDGNTGNGISAAKVCSIRLFNINGQFSVDNNGQSGIISGSGSNLTVVGGGGRQVLNNGARGVFVNINGQAEMLNATIQNNTIGVFAATGGQAFLSGSVISGNTTNTNVPVNAMAGDGAYILN